MPGVRYADVSVERFRDESATRSSRTRRRRRNEREASNPSLGAAESTAMKPTVRIRRQKDRYTAERFVPDHSTTSGSTSFREHPRTRMSARTTGITLAKAVEDAAAAETVFHLLCFEGPDAYSRAGGLASRIDGLAQSLADRGFETHLWFVGDPALPARESHGNLHLHRWCQWISHYHPSGVYEGEEGKHDDFAASLPPHLLEEELRRHLVRGRHAVILAEEWHTADAVLHLDWLLRRAGLRPRASVLWNANNLFGFDRIDWHRLAAAAVITTVSRYMRQSMRKFGVDPIVIPNGLSSDAFLPPDPGGVAEMHRRLRGRTILAKMARFDPAKRWIGALEIVRELKRQGDRPLLIARGGAEAHGHEVFAAARAAGLRVVARNGDASGVTGLLGRLGGAEEADIINLEAPVDSSSRRVLLHSADAVLANSDHEPFGLVGLEAMAAGGLACTGISGEDYAVPGRNALVLQTTDPCEFVGLYRRLQADPTQLEWVRQAGRATATQYAWPEILEREFFPRLDLLRSRAAPSPAAPDEHRDACDQPRNWREGP
jgi:glycosyltransferase involved in cell wall biosynthesis